LIAAVSSTPRVADALLAADTTHDAWVMANPAAWFISLYRWIAGDQRPIFALLGSRALLGTGLVLSIAIITYPAAYQRCQQKAIAGEGRRDSWWTGALSRAWLRVLRPFLRTPLERGLAAFITATVTRSHTHRFVIGSYAGLGILFALPMMGRLTAPADTEAVQFAWFSVPLGLLCWTAASLRVAMMLPVEPRSNWIFKLTEPVDKRRVLSTAVTMIRAATAVPLAVAFGVASSLAGGLTLGVNVAAVVLATGVALIELLTLTMKTVPGTCTYRPGQLRLRVFWPLYLMTWTFIAYILPGLAVGTLGNLSGAVLLVGLLAATSAALQAWRRSRARRLEGFVYENLEPPVTTTIDLSSARV
jgi:hypothetical protein